MLQPNLKKTLFILSLFVYLFASLRASEVNLFETSTFSKDNGWKIAVDKVSAKAGGSIFFEEGKAVVECPNIITQPYAVHLVRTTKLELGAKYRMKFEAEVESPGTLEIVYGTRKAPYKIYCRQYVQLEPGQKEYEVVLGIKEDASGVEDLSRHYIIRLYFGGQKNTKLTMSNIELNKLLPTNLSDSWSLFFGAKQPESYSRIPKYLEAISGGYTSPKVVALTEDSIDLLTQSDKPVAEGSSAILYNKFMSEESGLMHIGMAADYWMEVYVNGEEAYSTMAKGNIYDSYEPGDHIFTFPVNKGENIIAVKVLSGSQGWRFVCGIPSLELNSSSARPNITFVEDSIWKAYDMPSLEVTPGSALDLSNAVDAPAGKYGRAIVNQVGRLAFADNPEKSIRIRGFNGVPREVWQYGNEEGFEIRAVRFAKAARRQGYNLVRLNMLEGELMRDVTEDMSHLNANYLRRWDFLLAALKEEGIYSHLVLASYSNYYGPFTYESEIFKRRNENKLKMSLGDKGAREHWEFGATLLLNHVNPYTGIAWKDDPSIATVEFYNEQENGIRKYDPISAADPSIKELLEERWHAWLKNKFKDGVPAALSKELKGQSLDSVEAPSMLSDSYILANEFSLFLLDTAIENVTWYENIVRKAGYKGLVTQYNFSKKLGFSAARWQESQVVSMNGYFTHPHNDKVDQFSSVEKMGDYFRSINSTRLVDRPFFITEFNHAFHNQYQHELGLMMGAYSSLQGHSSIMIHSGPVDFTVDPRAIRNFTSSSSPIIRASEFLAGCLFFRGDVQESPNTLDLRITQDYLTTNKNSNRAINSNQTKMALISGFGLSFSDMKTADGIGDFAKSTMILSPEDGSVVTGTEWASSIQDSTDEAFSLDDAVSKLRESGIIAASNISKPSEGVFQSDTGEITMRANEKLLKVIADRTEAISIAPECSEDLNLLKIKNTNVSATIAACSVDGSLESSKRIVFLYITQVANTNMVLSSDRKELINQGSVPILLQTGLLSASLKNTNSEQMALYSLNFDGTRKERIAVTHENGAVKIELDTSKLKKGPSVFFELVAESVN